MAGVDTDRLQQICERGLAAVGYELVDLEYARDPQGWVLRIFIDHPQTDSRDRAAVSAISLHDCEQASHHLGTVLDVEDLIPNAYRLEVSSPGVQRPIRKEQDFARFVGREVRVQMIEPVEGRKNFVGPLRAAAGGVISVEVDGHLYALPLGQMKRARLEVDLTKLSAAGRGR